MTRYQHIFFDLDHTLWDFHANSVEALGELYHSFKLNELTKASTSEVFIERYIHHNERMWGLYRENRMSKGRLRKARFEAALEDFGLNDKRLAKQLGDAYLDVCPRKTKLNDGAIEVLDDLRKDHELHILSNGFHETQLIKLDVSGLAPYFKHVITSERASAKKPNPRMYEFAERITGAPKQQSLMIGDNLDIDVAGALNYGWEAIHFNEHVAASDDRSVNRLIDLIELIRGKGR